MRAAVFQRTVPGVFADDLNRASTLFYYWRSRLENEIIAEQPTFVEVKQIEKTVMTTRPHSVPVSWNKLHFKLAYFCRDGDLSED